MKLLIASNNRHKLEEIRKILDTELPGAIELLTPNDMLDEPFDVEENGTTLYNNAFLKAHAFFNKTNIPCIADDTGLEIDALDGQPGIRSARFAGEHGNDALNRKKVLDMLSDTPRDRKSARFRTVICYTNGGLTELLEGTCEGKIISRELGSAGFGYDSIFVPDGFKKTFAQMTSEEKNSISHRGKAIRNLVEFLKTQI